jgi:hypothetical protein
MAWGKLRKIWEKVKGVGPKVWGGIKNSLPFIKPVASALANVVAPGSGLAVSKGIDIAEQVGDTVASGNVKNILGGIITGINMRVLGIIAGQKEFASHGDHWRLSSMIIIIWVIF